MRQPLTVLLAVLILASNGLFQGVQAESDSKLIEKARAEYAKGDYEKAIALLQEDMKNNPEDGTTHFYLGLVKKEMGEDLPALDELELAARLLPAETLAAYTKQALDTAKAGQTKTGLKTLPLPPKPKDWWQSVQESFDLSKPFQMPDMMAGFDEMYRQAKKMVKGQDKARKRGGSYQSWAAKTMSMADIQDLVRKSKVINPDRWASHPDGLQSFRQTPPDSPAWDYWINRYKRSFQYILMSHLAKEGEVNPYGSVACIFSIDNKGNLRGHIYASTASQRLNRCLLKTIRELNHSRVLEFPRGAKISGYNFQMKWDFGKLLRFIAYVRAVKKRQAELLAQQEAEAKLMAKKALEAKLLAQKKKAAALARQKRLALLKKKQALEAQYERKAEVAGLVLPAPKPVELKARQMTLADVPFSENLPEVEGDPFSTIDDATIMRWPDVNR
ncbi:MAG: hypothetical protein H6677_14245 [Candidatus Obscuribacterales bacterium]|nr:hypothetical protein [Candidatus Obscuribacterales bacterium]